jgi:hypothetical protein
VHSVLHTLSPAASSALIHSYRVGFTDAFTSVLVIGGVIAFAGAVFAFVLVRSRDFVTTTEPSAAQETGAAEPVGVAG